MRDEAKPHGLSERFAQHAVVMLDRLRRQAALAVPAAAGEGASVVFLQMRRRELGKPVHTEGGDKVLLDDDTIAVERGRGDPVGVVREPVFEIVGDRQL